MCGPRLDGVLALTALALTLSTAALAASDTLEQGGQANTIEALIPLPQPAEVRPPTRADLVGPTAAEPNGGSPSTPSQPTVSLPAPPAASEAIVAIPEPVDDIPKAGTSIEPPSSAEIPPTTAEAPATAPPPTTDPDRVEPSAGVTGAVHPARLDPPKDAAPAAPSPRSPFVTPPPSTPAAAPKPSENDRAAPKTTEQVKEVAKPLAADLAATDVPIAEKLRELLAGKLERLLERKKERPAVDAFYTGRGFAPLWIANGGPNPRAKAAVARLKEADLDGLDPNDYATPDFAAAADRPDALAEAELKLTNAVLSYARAAQLGRVHFSRISSDIFFNQTAPEPADVLATMATAADLSEALGSYNPPQEGYRALRTKLAELRSGSSAGPAHIPSGPVLKIGMRDDRVRALRQRLGLGSSPDATYDKPVFEAVKRFQRDHDLSANGTLNAATLDALNGPQRARQADVLIANMERWRWLPRDLGKTHVMVNIPDFSLKVVHNGAIVWRTRIVVGKPSTPTPLLSETMKYITINPTWNVPPSIVNNEYLPVLQQDPYALSRIGLRVEYNRDGSIHIFQPPGDGNALGRIRFNFPNKFLVYQHDTPDKQLFGRDKRAYSHGCMRVQDPLKYGEVLLSLAAPNQGYTAERLRRMFGSEEHDIHLQNPIPVHLSYQTAFVDETGKLVLRDDVYGRDARVLAALKGEDRRFADIPVERSEPRSQRHQAIRLPPRYPNFAPTYNGFPFFDRMFR